MEINGTLSHADDYTIDRNGELYLWSKGNSVNKQTGTFRFINITIRSRGKLETIGLPGNLHTVTIDVDKLIINGGGTLLCNDLKISASEITVDVAGLYHAFNLYSREEQPYGVLLFFLKGIVLYELYKIMNL